MSTGNFISSDFFDLWAGDDEAAANAVDIFDALDPDCMFHRFELVPGYYEGAQIVPTVPEYNDPRDMDNESCRYYFDMCRSRAIRAFDAERRRINKKILPELGRALGFHRYTVAGRFSNGETIYTRAE